MNKACCYRRVTSAVEVPPVCYHLVTDESQDRIQRIRRQFKDKINSITQGSHYVACWVNRGKGLTVSTAARR